MSVAWLHECFQRKDFELVHEDTSTMCADIYTKAFSDAVKWQHACELANIVEPQEFERRLRRKGGLDPPVPQPRPSKTGGTSCEWDGAPCRGYSVHRKRSPYADCKSPEERAVLWIKRNPVILERYSGADGLARMKPTPPNPWDASLYAATRPPLSQAQKASCFYFADPSFDPDHPNDEDGPWPDQFLKLEASDLSSCGGGILHIF